MADGKQTIPWVPSLSTEYGFRFLISRLFRRCRLLLALQRVDLCGYSNAEGQDVLIEFEKTHLRIMPNNPVRPDSAPRSRFSKPNRQVIEFE